MLGGLKGGAHKACGRGVGFGEDYSARARTAVEAAKILPGQIIVDNALLEELSRAYDESIATTTRVQGQNEG